MTVGFLISAFGCSSGGEQPTTPTPESLDRIGENARDAASVALMPTPPDSLRACRSGKLIALACPRQIPRTTRLRYNARWIVQSAARETFEFHWGASSPFYLERDRPPRVAHVVVEAATAQRANRLTPFTTLDSPVTPNNGLLRDPDRENGFLLGHLNWRGRDGDLLLAPPYPSGGIHGNHVMFLWKGEGLTYVISLHGWEPFREAVATLRAIVASLPTN